MQSVVATLALSLVSPPLPASITLPPAVATAYATVADGVARLPQTADALLAAASAQDVDAALTAVQANPGGCAPAAVALALLLGKLFDGAILPRPPEAMLKGTVLEGRKLRRCYKASTNGWNAAKFHDCCDFRGPCVIVGASGASTFGAFNPLGWQSTDDYSGTSNAFLFVKKGSEWIKLPKVGGGEAAVYDYARSGPTFGADALIIGRTEAAVMGGFSGPDMESRVSAGNLRNGFSILGRSYAAGPPPFDVTIFGGRRTRSQIKEVEVWHSPDLAMMVEDRPYRTSGQTRQKRTYI